MGNNLCTHDQEGQSQFQGAPPTMQPPRLSLHNQLQKDPNSQDDKSTNMWRQNESKKAKIKINDISFGSLHVIGKTRQFKRINQYQLDIPFQIAILSISDQLRRSLSELADDLMLKYLSGENKAWKLHKNGYYVNYLTKKTTAILTDHVYFQGELIEDNSRILPKSTGILITERGRYQGHFIGGKASQQSRFHDRIKQARYQGSWKQGKFIKGLMSCQQYQFDGYFQNNIANNQGQLRFKDADIKYKGKFINGKFNDLQGIYKSKDYQYMGGFVNGKKQGQGILTQTQRNYKEDKRAKYRPPSIYEGLWKDDTFLNLRQMENTATAIPTQQQIEQQRKRQMNQSQKRTNFETPKLSQTNHYETTLIGKSIFVWTQKPKQKKTKSIQQDSEDF